MKAIPIQRKDVISLKFHCPFCMQKMSAGEEMLGREVECPDCTRTLQVPDLKELAPPFAVKRISASRRNIDK